MGWSKSHFRCMGSSLQYRRSPPTAVTAFLSSRAIPRARDRASTNDERCKRSPFQSKGLAARGQPHSVSLRTRLLVCLFSSVPRTRTCTARARRRRRWRRRRRRKAQHQRARAPRQGLDRVERWESRRRQHQRWRRWRRSFERAAAGSSAASRRPAGKVCGSAPLRQHLQVRAWCLVLGASCVLCFFPSELCK